MNKYLKFEYWNTCDLGNIYYQGGQHFIFYLDADVGEPIHEEVEEGQENGDGDFIATYRRQMKRYRIRTGLIPDYLIDAIQRMKLHDHIELTFKSGEVEQIYNVDVEAEWQFEKYAWQGTVTLTFDMDESITVGACCDNLTVTDAIPEWYWIATDGSDDTGDGHYTTPWKTLAYACTQVTTPGDVIHLKAGTYNETAQSVLAPGVSIVGAGDTSIITTAAALNPMIKLSSAAGTNGNQSISYVRIDGDLTALAGITVNGRSNVLIHHCTIIDILHYGLTFCDAISNRSQLVEPPVYATGNRIYSNNIVNCGTDAWVSGGYSYWGAEAAVDVSGQDGMLVYSNTIDNLTGGRHAYALKGLTGGGYNRGLKIYDNTLRTSLRDVAENAWSFNIELWTGTGGIEIYNNDCNGGIDLGGYGYSDEYGYGYALRCYNNTVKLPSLSVNNAEAGIVLEGGADDGVYIYKNWVENFSTGLTIGTTSEALIPGMQDLYVYYNVFANIGFSAGGVGSGIQGYTHVVAGGLTYSNINFMNNVIHKVNNASGWGINFETNCDNDWDNVKVINNIIYNCYTAMQFENQGDIDIINVDNNLVYNHTNATIVSYAGSSVTNNTYDNNIIGSDPTFVTPGSDFHLQAGSPCINAGIDVGLTTDYDGQAVSDPPDIGAYEYQE